MSLFSQDFFPTPPEVAALMLDPIDLRGRVVVEPTLCPFAAMDDTLLNRCVQAWADEHCTVPMTVERRQLCARGVRAVLEHLAAELLVQHQRNPDRMSAHEAARWIRAELEGQP